MGRSEMAFALFTQLVHAYEIDENSKASPKDADFDRVALKAYRWTDAFLRVQKSPEGRAPKFREDG
jgi:hypothetical protein